jgi:hypothetical protein
MNKIIKVMDVLIQTLGGGGGIALAPKKPLDFD